MRKAILTAFVLLAGVYTPAFGMYGAPGSITLGNGSVSEQADTLVAAIYQTIGTRLDTASNTDLEGYVVFLIGQRNYAPEVVNTALDRLAASNSRLATVAQNVRAALARKKSQQGTAAIVPSTQNASGANVVEVPGVGSGASTGTVNYAS